PLARHVAVALAREPASIWRVARDGAGDGFADPPRAVRERRPGRPRARRRRRPPTHVDRHACPTRAPPGWRLWSAAGMARGLGPAGARAGASARVAPVRAVSRARHRRPAHAAAGG